MFECENNGSGLAQRKNDFVDFFSVFKMIFADVLIIGKLLIYAPYYTYFEMKVIDSMFLSCHVRVSE